MTQGMDYTYTVMSESWFRDPTSATTCYLRGFEVIVFPENAVLLGDDLLAVNPNLAAVLSSATKAAVTGLHLGSHTNKTAFHQMAQQFVQWLAEDCSNASTCPSGTDQQPAVLAMSDRRDGLTQTRYSYLPWSGVQASAMPQGSGFIGYEDVTFLSDPSWGGGTHSVYTGLADFPTTSNCSQNSNSLDHAHQSVHHVFRAGIGGGYETNGFVASLLADPEIPDPPVSGCNSAVKPDPLPLGDVSDILLNSCPSTPPTCAGDCNTPFECNDPAGVSFTVDVQDPDGGDIVDVECRRNRDPDTSQPGVLIPDCTLNGAGDTVTLNDPDVEDLGTHTYTIIVTDENGDVGECEVCAVLQDSLAPVGVSCGGTLTLQADNSCSKTVLASDYVNEFGTKFVDQCEGDLPPTAMWEESTAYPIGSYQLSLRADDSSTTHLNRGTCDVTLEVTPPPPPAVPCPSLLNPVPGEPDDVYEVDWTKPMFCDGTCCTPLVNGVAVEDGELIILRFDLEQRHIVLDDGRKIFYGPEVCLSTTCDDGTSGCPETCTALSGNARAHIPFFREDPAGQNKPGTIITLSNRNDVNTKVRVDIYDCTGARLNTQIENREFVVSENGNQIIPDLIDRIRLRDLLDTPPVVPVIGNIVVTTLASEPSGTPLDHRVEARAYVLGNGDDLNSPDGFALTSQWESSVELWEDIYVDVANGGSSNYNLREFIIVTNPSSEPVKFRIDFWTDTGSMNTFPNSPWPRTGADPDTIPPHGCFTYNTAALHDPIVNPLFVIGNGVVTSLPNVNGDTIPVVGASVVFGPSDGGNDTEPTDAPTEGDPSYGSDLRTDLRK